MLAKLEQCKDPQAPSPSLTGWDTPGGFLLGVYTISSRELCQADMRCPAEAASHSRSELWPVRELQGAGWVGSGVFPSSLDYVRASWVRPWGQSQPFIVFQSFPLFRKAKEGIWFLLWRALAKAASVVCSVSGPQAKSGKS